VAFFLTLGQNVNGNKRLKVLLAIAQISGLLSSVFLIITALFPLGTHTAVHEVSGKLYIIILGFFMTFSASVFIRRSVSRRWPAYFGFTAAVINFVYGAFLHSVFVAEWLAIGAFIIYVLLISFTSRVGPIITSSPPHTP